MPATIAAIVASVFIAGAVTSADARPGYHNYNSPRPATTYTYDLGACSRADLPVNHYCRFQDGSLNANGGGQ